MHFSWGRHTSPSVLSCPPFVSFLLFQPQKLFIVLSRYCAQRAALLSNVMPHSFLHFMERGKNHPLIRGLDRWMNACMHVFRVASQTTKGWSQLSRYTWVSEWIEGLALAGCIFALEVSFTSIVLGGKFLSLGWRKKIPSLLLCYNPLVADEDRKTSKKKWR